MKKTVVPRQFFVEQNKHFNHSNVINEEKDIFRWPNAIKINSSSYDSYSEVFNVKGF